MLAFLSVSPDPAATRAPSRNRRVEGSRDRPITSPSLRAIPQTRRVARDKIERTKCVYVMECACVRVCMRACVRVMKCNKLINHKVFGMSLIGNIALRLAFNAYHENVHTDDTREITLNSDLVESH